MNEAAVASLKGKLAEVADRKDNFELGTVIRWTASGKYSYAALKTEVGWATTAQVGNRFVDGALSYERLLEVLMASETTDVMVSTGWDSIG